MPTTTTEQQNMMAAAIEANLDSTCNVFQSVYNSSLDTYEPPDIAHDTPVNGSVKVACDIFVTPPVAAPFQNSYLQNVNIGEQDYRNVVLPLSFLLAHPTLRAGWEVVHTNAVGTHVYVIRRVNVDESEILFVNLDAEKVEAF